jgi:hypothetical protein
MVRFVLMMGVSLCVACSLAESCLGGLPLDTRPATGHTAAMNIDGKQISVSKTRTTYLDVQGCGVAIDPMFGGVFSVSVRNPRRMMAHGTYYNRRRDLDYARIPQVVEEMVNDALGT